jgi:hypothetical protein
MAAMQQARVSASDDMADDWHQATVWTHEPLIEPLIKTLSSTINFLCGLIVTLEICAIFVIKASFGDLI